HGAYSAISDDAGVVALVRNDGFGMGNSVEVFRAPGRLVGRVKISAGKVGHSGATVALSPDGRFMAVHSRSDAKLRVYEVPLGNAVAAAPNVEPDPAAAPKVEPNPPQPGDAGALKHRWVAKLDDRFSGQIAFDREAKAVVVSSSPPNGGGGVALGYRTKDGV